MLLSNIYFLPVVYLRENKEKQIIIKQKNNNENEKNNQKINHKNNF